jgi:hypothetical protein
MDIWNCVDVELEYNFLFVSVIFWLLYLNIIVVLL